jgi:hypothetical protein
MIRESIKINILPIKPISHGKDIEPMYHEKRLNHVSFNIPSISIYGES